MATLTIGRGRRAEEALPDICACCGAPATVHKSKTFSWYPRWILFLLMFGVLGVIIFVVLAASMTKKRELEVPLCDRHRNHWLWNQLIILGGFAVLAVIGILGLVLMSDREGGNDEFGKLICIGTVVVLVVWLIVTAVLSNRTVHATEITDNKITLAGLCQPFADAYEEEMDRRPSLPDRDADERWRDASRKRPPSDEDEDRYRRGEDEDRPRSDKYHSEDY